MDEDEDVKRTYYISPSRIQDLTDGIFAFSMTLLIVGMAIPQVAGHIGDENYLVSQLANMWPTFITFVMSFLLIAIFWMNHHKQFQLIKKSNDALVWINIVMMLFVVLIPFTTKIVDSFGGLIISNIVFNLNIFLVGLLYYIQFDYAASHKLIDEHIPFNEIRYYRKRYSLILYVALAAFVVGLFWPRYCSMLYISIPFLILYVRKKVI